jgi:hypothetical protein
LSNDVLSKNAGAGGKVPKKLSPHPVMLQGVMKECLVPSAVEMVNVLVARKS